MNENPKSGYWHFLQVLLVGQNEVFDVKGDEFDCNWVGCRNKTFHSIGLVAKSKWVSVGDHPYTGVFRGSDTGYMRYSNATPIDKQRGKMTPGMGYKFLRDGVDSGNFVAMFSVDG